MAPVNSVILSHYLAPTRFANVGNCFLQADTQEIADCRFGIADSSRGTLLNLYIYTGTGFPVKDTKSDFFTGTPIGSPPVKGAPMIGNRLQYAVVFLALLALPTLASGGQSKDFARTVEFTSGGQLKINSLKGSVKLTGWDRNQVEIVARIVMTERVDADFARRAVEAVRIEVSGDARQLSIRPIYDDVPRGDGLNYLSRPLPDVNFEIQAPRHMSLILDTDRTEVELRGIDGTLNLKSDRGKVTAHDVGGDVRLKMDRGGNSALSGLRGTLTVEMDRSDLTVGALEISGDSRLDVSRGEVEMKLPRTQGLSVSANIGRRADFDSEFAISTSKFRDRVEGDINGGGPKLLIHTDRGKVELKASN